MPIHAILTIEGQNSGEIQGGCTIKPHEGKIEVLAFNHRLNVPLVAATGEVTGKVANQPVTIVKEIDRATPKLFSTLINNEVITKWELRFFQITEKGALRNYFTIKLDKARVIEIKSLMSQVKKAESKGETPLEEISFTYGKITWVHEPTGTETQFDWTQNA